MPTALIAPLIGAGTSLISGLFGASAADKAAKKQADAAAAAAAAAKAAGDQAATDVTAAGRTAASGVSDAGQTAAGGVTAAGQTAASGVTQAGANANTGVRLDADTANNLLRTVYGDNTAALAPYTSTGAQANAQLQAGISEGGQFTKQFDPSQLESDPGYQFRLQQGNLALQRSAAANGSLQSGGTLKALTRYSQGVASDEYQKAFDRFQTTQNTAFSRLNTLNQSGQQAVNTGVAAGQQYAHDASGNIINTGEFGQTALTDAAARAGQFGLTSASQAGQFGLTGAADAGQFTLQSVADAGKFRVAGTQQANSANTAGAAASAAGTVGSANAWSNSLGGVARAAQGYFTPPPAGPYDSGPTSYGLPSNVSVPGYFPSAPPPIVQPPPSVRAAP